MKTNTAHTPGPWTAQPTHGNGWGVFATPLQFNVLDNSAPEPINAEANARLIAAAPELLAALEIAEATLQRLAPDGSRATQGTRDVITAALAKAKGVQP